MSTFDLGRTFDAVTCLSSSIAHMRTVADLRKAVANMTRHVSPGGVLLVEPWPAPGEDLEESQPWITTVEADDIVVTLMETTTLDDDTWNQVTHYLTWTRDGIEHWSTIQVLGAFSRQDIAEAFHGLRS